MTYYGKFNEYVPETYPADFPEDMKGRVVWLRNEDGVDLYDLRRQLPVGPKYVTVEDDFSVRVVHDDPQQVWPSAGGHLYSTLNDLPLDPDVHRRSLFDPQTESFVAKPEPVPVAVSKAQAQMALFNAGLLDQVEALVKSHPYRPVRIWYEGASTWERSHPYVAMLAPELDLSDEQIDALFIAASKL